MARSAVIQARIDPETKNKAQDILKQLNLTMSEAINLFLTQVALNRGIPFDIRIPNDLTALTLNNAENNIDVHEVSNVDELFQELES